MLYSNIPNSEYISITNSQGIATYNYVGIGYGDLTVTGTLNILSDSVSIEDYFMIGFNDEDVFSPFGAYTTSPSPTISDGNLLSPSNNGNGGGQSPRTFQANKWEATFEIQVLSPLAGRFGIKPKTSTGGDRKCTYVSGDNSYYCGGSKNDSTARSQASISSLAQYTPIKMIGENNTAKIYVNDVLKLTIFDAEWVNEELCFYIHKWNNGTTINVRNMKVKRLSS